jgi:serine/threonine protein kinase/DNA-binding SARP family transcriptional activator
MSERVAIDVLGTVRLRLDGVEQDLGGNKPRTVLAILAMSVGHEVTTERLIDSLWHHDPPTTARKAVQVHVSNLRRAFGDSDALKTSPSGYVLTSDDVEIDAVEFESALTRAVALVRSDPGDAIDVLTDALGRWRGSAYSDLAGEPAIDPEIQRLDELRMRALGARADAALRLGRHEELLGELEALASEHPYREQFRRQHMLALYRSGRQADALRAFARTRQILAEELGIEPSKELRDLELQILEQDPTLDATIDETATGFRSRAFLVTDIESSTENWERDPEAMGAALSLHDELLTTAIVEAGGEIFKHTGDGVLAVFADVAAAAAAGVAAQQAIAQADWPTTSPLRVRMAVDEGPVEARDDDYFGPVLNRVMRVMSAGHGGQLLTSVYAANALGGELRSLGDADLKGLGRLEVLQITAGGLEDVFPELRTDRSPPALARSGFGHAIRGYELREQLTAGEGGIVYRAYQPSVGREVAIKVIRAERANDPAFVKRFEAEAQFIAQLEHPHVVAIYDYWRDPEGAYLVMPYLKGGNLAQRLEVGQLNLPPVGRLVDQVGTALAYAHRHGVIHRDIKPGNVLLDEDGNHYLADFGIASDHLSAVGGPPPSTVAYLAPEELAAGPIDTRSDIYCFGLLIHEALTGHRPELGGQPGSTVARRPELPRGIDEVIARATSQDPTLRFERVEDFLRAFRQTLGTDVLSNAAAEPVGELRNPYKGLRAFGETDAADFYGRDAVVEQVLDSLKSRPLTAAVGPSGIGKSSVVRAGVLPAVRSGALGGDTSYLVADMFPGSFPFEELEASLLRVAVDRPEGLLADLEADDRGLLRVSKQILPDDDSTLLLVIDQFEELFSLVTSEDVRTRFLESLVAVAADERSRVRVLVTMRADFFDRPLRYPEFGALLEHGLVTVAMPSDDNLALAVSRPARDAGLELEPGLVPTIVRDVSRQPGGLPLLQYALTDLFDRRQGRDITMEAYDSMGGVLGALARRAEEIQAELAPAAQRAAQHLFLRLVAVSEDGEDTRRRVRRSELVAAAEDRAALDAAIDAFGSYRLLSFDHDAATRSPTVEVAHEALIREWPRLRGWVDEHREDLLLERRLEEAAREWDDHQRDPSYLLGGGRLAQFQQWRDTTNVQPTAVAAELLTASEARAEDDAIEAQEQERRSVRLRRRSRLLVGTGVVLVALLVLSVLAWQGRNDANAERERAEELQIEAERLNAELAVRDDARSLTIDASLLVEVEPQLALGLALEAARLTADLGDIEPETLDVFHFGLQQSGFVFPADEQTPVGVRPSPDGLQGVFLLEVDEMIELAQASARPFTADECDRYFPATTCPDPTEPIGAVPVLRGGLDDYLAFTDPDAPLRGSSLRVQGNSWSLSTSLERMFAREPLLDGVQVSVVAGDDLLSRVAQRSGFDALLSPQPGTMRAAAESGEIIDISSIVSGAELEARFGPGLAAVARPAGEPVDGAVIGIPDNVDNKSLLYYSTEIFDAGGYEIPDTFEGLVALSETMVADGVVPWCWATSTVDGGGGFPVTDWVELLVLRTAGPEVYDGWAAGDVPFTSEPIRAAFEMLGELVFPEGYTANGAATVPVTNHWARWFELASDEPPCAMALGASFAMSFAGVPETLRERAGIVPVPPLAGEFGDAFLGAGNFFSLGVDSPETRALLAVVQTHDYYRARLLDEPTYLSPDPSFDYGADAAASHIEIARLTYDALASATYRFDASDLMPPEVGGREFFVAPNEWFREGPSALSGVLQRIDESWIRPGEILTGELGDVVPEGPVSLDLDGAVLTVELPTSLLVGEAGSGVYRLGSDTNSLRYFQAIRPFAFKDRDEALDPDPSAASIPTDDIDRWLEDLPIEVLNDESVTVGGFPARRLSVAFDTADPLEAAPCDPVAPCFYILGYAGERSDVLDLIRLETADAERLIWVIDIGVGDPIFLQAGSRTGPEFLDQMTRALESAAIDITG